MRNIFVRSVMLLLLISLLLCSCHGEKQSIPETPDRYINSESFDENKNYEITFWAKNDTNVTQINIYEKAIADFEKLYPNITVKLKPYTDYRRIYNDVITNIATDTTPNVCITYPDHIATYITGKDTVLPLDNLISDENIGLGGKILKFSSPEKQQVVKKFLQEGKINGVQYALPFMRSTEACYINKTMVEKMGYEIPEKLTWDFVWEVSEAAMEKDDNGNFVANGQKVMIPFIYKSTDNMMIQMLYQQNAPYSSENGKVLIFNDITKSVVEKAAYHANTRSFSTFKISSYPGNFFNAEQCIFAIDSTAGATWIGADSPNSDISKNNTLQFETVVKTIPQYDTENPKMISQGPSVCIFNKEDEGEVVASWLFTQFLLTNDVQIAYSQTEGYVPVTHMAQNSTEYKDYISRMGEDKNLYYDVKIKAAKLLMENTENTFVTPVFNGSADLRSAAGEMIEIAAKSVRRGKTVDEKFVDEVFSEVNALYRLDSISGNASQVKNNLGPLPTGSKILIGCLCAVWILMGVCVLTARIKRK